MRLKFGLADISGIVKRRFFLALITALLCALALLFVINKLPSQFESRAELIVEDQQVRNEYVASAVASDALARIQAVAARVLARDNLLRIATDQGFYSGAQMSATARAEDMKRRANISVDRIQTEGGRRGEASAITVEISFRADDPAIAQRMTNAVLTDFVTRSVELRTDIAGDTTSFLREEESKMRRQLDEVIADISEIKRDNADTLPENRNIYQNTLDRLSMEKNRISSDIDSTQAQIALVSMQRPAILEERRQSDPLAVELQSRRRDLAALRRDFTETFPDVIAAVDDVLDLEADVDPAGYRRSVNSEIARIDTALTDAEGSARSTLEERKSALEARRRSASSLTTNPNIGALSVDAQLGALNTQLAGLRNQERDLNERIREAEVRLATLPSVERQLIRLEQQQEELTEELGRIRSNRSEAERSQSLEQQAKAERLTPLVQPTRPDSPTSPNRPALALLAIGLSGFIGAAIGLIPEVFMPKIRINQHMSEFLPGAKVLEVPRFGQQGLSRTAMGKLIANSAISLALIVALGVLGYQTVT